MQLNAPDHARHGRAEQVALLDAGFAFFHKTLFKRRAHHTGDAGQLRGLLDDDGFLTLLANEYLRQQQRALQQAQQARQRKEAATTSASTPTDAVAASLPAHLASLMQSAGLK